MDQPVASVKAAAAAASRAPRGGAARGHNGSSSGRARKNGHALKFHNFIANDSWSAATHCLREEHGTKQITVSHWTPSQGSNNNSNNNSNCNININNNNSSSSSKNQNSLSCSSLASVNQVKQQEQSQHPPQAPHGLNQQKVLGQQANKSPGELSLQNNNRCQPFTSGGQASQSILESLLAKNILSSQGRPVSPYPPHAAAAHLHHPALEALAMNPSAPKIAPNSSHKEERGNNKELLLNNKVNRRKAFVVRRVVHNCNARSASASANSNSAYSSPSSKVNSNFHPPHPLVAQKERKSTSLSTKRTAPPSKSGEEESEQFATLALLAPPEQPLDLSIKKQSNGRPVTTVNSSESPSNIHSSRQGTGGGMSAHDSVEYLIRSVEQSAAQAASIIARANGSYANSNSSFPSSSSTSSSSSPCLSFPPPSASSNCSSSTAHNATVTTIANWVEMNKTKDNDVVNNRHNCSLPFNTTCSSSLSPSSSSAPKSTVRQKLEDAFRQNGFLVKTKQVSDGDATFCKFRQLRKYTRYYLKSWHKHLPDEVSQLYKVSYKNFKGFLPPNSDRR